MRCRVIRDFDLVVVAFIEIDPVEFDPSRQTTTRVLWLCRHDAGQNT